MGTGASMRPPEFTGGNGAEEIGPLSASDLASMRPPEFTGGNVGAAAESMFTAFLLQ